MRRRAPKLFGSDARLRALCWRGGREGSSKVARGLLEGAPSCFGTAGERRALTRAVGAEGVGAARKSLAWQHLRGNICVHLRSRNPVVAAGLNWECSG